MNYIREFLDGDRAHLVYSFIIFLLSVTIVLILYKWIIKKLTIRVGRSESQVDNFVVQVLRLPFLCLLVWIAVRVFSQSFFYDSRFIGTLNHGMRILLIITVGWILIQLNNILFYYLEKKVEEDTTDRYAIRGSMTKFSIFQKMIYGLIVLVVIGVCLMTFDKIRTIGLSVLTSAGIAGVILGFAAQKSLGMILAGIQIAITQPIKLNDLVVIDGDSGRIEEIKLTYVVVNLWDKRRLIIPVNYFLEQKFENWTRHSSDIMGTIFIYVDYRIPLNDLKSHLRDFVAKNPDWDHITCALTVNNLKETCIELRVLVSSEDAAKNNDLQTAIREEMLHYIQTTYPDYLTQTRITILGQSSLSPDKLIESSVKG